MDSKIVERGSGQYGLDAELRTWQTKPQTDIKERIGEFTNKQYVWKRNLDLVLAFFGTAIYFLMFPFIAAGIKLSSPGPVLFKQLRTGYRGETFYCYKFRTMHSIRKVTENGEPDVTQPGDKRIFAFGKFLRTANLDEFPQMINVLKGEMSLVGPRPYPIEECRYWDEIFDDHYYRYLVRPGVTGHAQVKGYRGGTLDVDSMRKRLNYDLIYTEKNSFFTDILIIFKTVLQMVTRNTNGH